MGQHAPIAGLDASDIETTDPVAPTEGANELCGALERDYTPLLGRLTAALRSRDNAVAALHDAYLRLANEPAVGEVRQPFAYLYRMALNLARNSLKREDIYRPLDQAEWNELPDSAPDQERVTFAKAELDLAMTALLSLPAQRRDIFLARWRDELGQSEIAARFGLHKRTVQKELARAERVLKHETDPVRWGDQ